MLLIKEGLTDPSELVRQACAEFLKRTMTVEKESQGSQENSPQLIDDLSHFFKIIDCKLMFVKEYYIQLPFIIMRYVLLLLGDDDLKLARYLETIINRLKYKAGVLHTDR